MVGLTIETRPDACMNHIGEMLFMRGDLDAAAENFRHAQNGAPDNPTACLWLAILAEQKGDFNQAAAELSKSAGLKEEAALNLRLSYYLTQANRVKEAVKVLEDAHKKWLDTRKDYERVPTDYMYFRQCMAYCACIEADMPSIAARIRAVLIKDYPDAAKTFGELDGALEDPSRDRAGESP